MAPTTPDDLELDPPLPDKPGITKRVARFHRNLETLDDHGLFNAQARISVRIYRFFLLLWAGIRRIEMPRRASALTYTTILSIFPLLAVISSSASFFYTPAKEQEFMSWIEKQFLPSMEIPEDEVFIPLTEEEFLAHEQQQKTSQNLRNMISSISQKFRDNAASVGVFGFIGLLATCGLLYYSIESVVNMTWQTEHRSRFAQTITSFITVLVFAPIILALSVASSTVAIMLLSPEVAEQAENAAVASALQKEGQAATKEEAKAMVQEVKTGDDLTTISVSPQKKQEVSRT
ncbi:MAG: YhjD/YihY/BrkB family envelope integrity protein, partial [Candidatus Sumerlaeota bacterium]